MPPPFTHTRPAAFAGTFYPDSPESLTREISRLFAGHPLKRTTLAGQCPKAIIVPHAGYIYSGAVAASAFSLLGPLRGKVQRVVLLGPAHRALLHGLALPACDCDAFVTPLGSVPIDRQAVAEIEKLPQVISSDAAHAHEHCLEVAIPFLQHVLGDFSLLPILVGQVQPAAVAEVLERLWGDEKTLILVSSDLSHYLPYEKAQMIDSKTAKQILALDPTLDHNQACGATPVNGLLLVARKLGLHAQQLDLRNSGDTAGDHARVVGYGAFAFFDVQK